MLFCGGLVYFDDEPGRRLAAKLLANVRFGSKAEVKALHINVCFTPESGHDSDITPCPLSANSGHHSPNALSR